VITAVPPKQQLSLLNIADDPFYIALPIDDELVAYPELRTEQMHKRNWMLLGKHANAHLYDTIHSVGAERVSYPSDIYQFTSPEEASELIREHYGLAFLPRSAAWRIARDGITMRPLAEPRLRLVTSLAVRADGKSRLVNEFVNTAGRKFGVIGRTPQGRLPLVM
jgi:hypothetical protein